MITPRFKIVKEEEVPTLPQSDRPRLLIAEDDPAIRRLLVRQLDEYEIIEATDGDEAHHLALEHRPDVIVLDWMMPKCDGLELTRRLRKNSEMVLTPIILLTGRNDEASKLEALQAGVNDFVTKPCSFLELQHRVRNMVTICEAQKEVSHSRELLVRSEKLSSLGELSAGIMHEINNPLNYAKIGLHALKMFADDLDEETRDEFADIVKDIDEGLTRVSQIAHDLKTFSRMGHVEMKRTNLSKIVKMSERLIGDKLTSVQYESDVSEDLFVYASESQVSQVLVNLLVNAVDALDDEERKTEEKIIRLTAQKTEEGINFSVWDNGCGISDEMKVRLFDPFYTTKEAGKGTGLGLSVCHRMLEAHGANLCVDSKEGEYTRFHAVLPDADVESEVLDEEEKEAPSFASLSCS